MASLEERVGRLEAAQENLVTKSDLADLTTGVKADLAKAKVEIIAWTVGVGIGAVALNSAVTIIGLRLMVG